ncbi:MAG: type I restriction enzyme HsdR N-terminal domain-containing protein [Clostridiales Family XIII bacterium]|jgi:hypothetical protein|nr:type I restriction enzyme HsdR N-terminal domain-containing protein [Clostridiales Family XIII bacterium]
MDFAEKISQFAERAKSVKEMAKTEEATKTSLIMPFFQILGYDVFNPLEFVPEFTADVGIKKGERVDYAIIMDGKPLILIECKTCGENLDKHGSQLFRYFATSVDSKFGILTDGTVYRFYTDLDKANMLDDRPFLEIDISNIKDTQIKEIEKFHKDKLDVNKILDSASEMKFTTLIKDWLVRQFAEPEDPFVKIIMDAIYDGVKTQKAIDTLRPLIKQSLEQFQKDITNARLKSAMERRDEPTEPATEEDGAVDEDKGQTVETTLEELEAFAIVKSILHPICDVNKLSYSDNERYMVVNWDNNSWKRICRFYFNSRNKYITTLDENKKPVRHDISTINDIYQYTDVIRDVCRRYL